jgi:hypothetical protein
VRVYGRINQNADGTGGTWVVVETDANGNNDLVYVTALIQVLKLTTGESPFFAQAGIPAQQSVIQQVFPDYYVSLIQQAYAPFFASLQITRASNAFPPTYTVTIVTNQGVKINASVLVPK